MSESDREIAEKMMSNGGRMTRDPLAPRCAAARRPGEILVCGEDPNSFRVDSTAKTDPNSREALDDGRLTPPDVSGPGIFKGKATMDGLCVVPPCPPEKPYLIDLSAIPEAPAGSDADMVGKGEMRAH